MSCLPKSLSTILLLAASMAPWGASPLLAARYISLAPSTTEILYALGLEDEIVGVSSFCNYPPATAVKPKMGDFSHPNIEKIISLKPNYIFCTGLEQAPVIEDLKRLKFNVYTADPANMNELFKTIIDIGTITDKKSEAQALVLKMKNDISEIKIKAEHIQPDKKVKVFIEIWQEPLMTAGKGSFIDELITLAGGINIAHDVIRPYCNYSAEKVVILDPGCIIMAYMNNEPPLKLIKSRFGWSAIDAIKKNRVFNDIDPDLLLRPGPRLTEGLKEIFARIYPNQ
jgi:iron complex transport system substrate-binding protein